MDFSKTLWLCFFCAGLACIRSLLLKRLDQSSGRSKPSQPSIGNSCSSKQRLDGAADSESVSFGVEQGTRAPLPSPTARSEIPEGATSHPMFVRQCGSPSDHELVLGRHDCDSLLQSACGSASCSVTGSTSSSRSSQSDSDVESDGRGRGAQGRISGDCSDEEHSRGPQRCGACSSRGTAAASTLPSSDRPRRPLRPAIRLPPGATSERSSPNVRQAKTVSFKAGGPVLCSPPTEAALSLLAAGAPTLPPPSLCSAAATALAAAAPPTAVAAAASSAVVQASHCAGGAADIRPGASILQHQPAATCTSSAPARLTVAQAAKSLRRQPPSLWTSIAPQCSDEAHASALACAALGRQRVMAALEEARCRHSHLGRSPLPGGWSMRAGAAQEQVEQQDAQRQQPLQLQEERRRCQDLSSERLARLPNQPLASLDSEILAVGYAAAAAAARSASLSSCSSAAASSSASAPTSAAAAAPGTGSAAVDGVQCSMTYCGADADAVKTTPGRADVAARSALLVSGLASAAARHVGGCRGASLRELLVADRMGLAETLAKQSYQM